MHRTLPGREKAPGSAASWTGAQPGAFPEEHPPAGEAGLLPFQRSLGSSTGVAPGGRVLFQDMSHGCPGDRLGLPTLLRWRTTGEHPLCCSPSLGPYPDSPTDRPGEPVTHGALKQGVLERRRHFRTGIEPGQMEQHSPQGYPRQFFSIPSSPLVMHVFPTGLPTGQLVAIGDSGPDRPGRARGMS